MKQKLIEARQGSKAQEGPIDSTINTQTGRISIEETQNPARGMHIEFCNVFHSTERDPEGAVMTRVIGFPQLW